MLDSLRPVADGKPRREAVEEVNRLREKLLDLSKRNKLLNFQPSDRSRTHIRVIDEVPEVLYQRLLDGKDFKIRPIQRPDGLVVHGTAPEITWQQAAESQGISTSFELPPPASEAPGRHRDNSIQVPHFADRAEAKMEGIRQTYRMLLEEMGIPALFAAFGFLEWREALGQPAQLAPLVLLPLEIERRREGYGYQYRIKAAAEDAEMNQSLALLLQRMHMELPVLGDGEPLADYLGRVGELARRVPGWGVRRQVTIGIFHFARQVMYQDLEPSPWQAAGWLSSHPVVSPLVLGSAFAKKGGDAPPVPERLFVDSLVTTADASQRQAIASALAGTSLVIKGPPGTGKSETITNLIATAIADGKTVLFMAEKMAALNVVKKRLDDAGLADFCLELHSTKTKKKDLVDELDRSHAARTDLRRRARPIQGAEELKQIEETFTTYDSILATRIGALGRRLGDLTWQAEQVRSAGGRIPEAILGITIGSAHLLTEADLRRDRQALAHLEEAWWAVADSEGRTDEHPWRFVERGDLSLKDQESVEKALATWRRSLTTIREGLEHLPGGGGHFARAGLARLHESLCAVRPLASARPSVIARLRSPEAAQSLEAVITDLGAYREARSRLGQWSTDPITTARTHEPISRLERLTAVSFQRSITLDRLIEKLLEERATVTSISASGAACASLLATLEPYGVARTPNPVTVTTLFEMVTWIRKAGKLLGVRSEQTVDSSRATHYQELARRAVALRDRAKRFDEARYAGWRDHSSRDLRAHALTLRTTGFFGRLFSRAYKAARHEYQVLTTGQQATPAVMADELQEVADWLDESVNWPSSPEVMRLTAGFNRGLDTDFEALWACNRWAAQVQAWCDESPAERCWALDALFCAPTDLLLAVDRGLSATHERALRQWLGYNPEGEMAAWLERALARIDNTQQALAATLAVSVKSSCRIEQLASIRDVASTLRTHAAAIENNTSARTVAGEEWHGVDTDIGVLTRVLDVRRSIDAVAWNKGLYQFAWANLESHLSLLRAAGESLRSALAMEVTARQAVSASGVAVERAWPESATVDDGLKVMQAAERTHEHLGAWVTFRHAWHEATRHTGVSDFLAALDWSKVPLDHLAEAYTLAVYRSLFAVAQRRFPELFRAPMSGRQLDNALARFVELDSEDRDGRRSLLVRLLAGNEVPAGTEDKNRSTELALIRHEKGKKTRHIPVRHLLRRSWGAVQALKPCMMMSPLSVAQYLEPGRALFDMVVIDEASQMKPEDALGALLRTHQVVVVGDKEQLPPTSFFDKMQNDDPDELDEEAEDISAESILDLALAAGARTSDLRWHYRSRHESLIGFSNEQFYDRRLHVFPSPAPGRANMGVRCELVSGLYGSSTNLPEATIVVDAVLDFMKARPAQSLGVVAMNQKQALLIQKLLDERLAASDIDYQERWQNTLEPFFVKNLENVQGDERDVIFVSLTYGPDASGRVYQRFFPINSQNGHRRLNVLFTRAKDELVLFSSMRPTDIRSEDGSPRGVRVLRDYLEYALSKGRAALRDTAELDQKGEPGWRHLSEELRRHDVAVETDIGQQNIRIPLAVRHPARAGEYACAVDCDLGIGVGDRSLSIRDRLALRATILPKLGWQTLATWTADWLRDPIAARSDLIRQVQTVVGRPLTRSVAPKSVQARSPEVVDLTTPAAVPTAVHPLVGRINRANHFAGARAHARWERLVVPVVDLLAREGGVATHADVADRLGFQKYRIQGVLTELQEHLNVDQHEVLQFDRQGQVRLDVALLEQLLDS